MHRSSTPSPHSSARTANAIGLVCLLWLPACAFTRTVPLGETAFAPRAEDHRLVTYDALEDVPRAFVKVARIRAEDGLFTDALDAVAEQARALGADALVLGPQPTRRDGCGDDDDWSVLAIRWVN